MDRDLFDFGEFTNINSKTISPEDNQESNFGGYGGSSDAGNINNGNDFTQSDYAWQQSDYAAQTTAESSYNTYNTYNAYNTYDQNAASGNFEASKGTSFEENEAAKSLLTQGIVSMALSFMPVVGLASIFIGIGCCVKKKSFVNKYGAVHGKSKVGSNLGLASIFTGIGLTAFYVLYFIFIFAIAGVI